MRLDGLSVTSRSLDFFRLPLIRREMCVREKERLAERIRIAQQLHDTVLQYFLGAFLQLRVAADQLPSNSPARPRLYNVLELMGRVIEEFRRAVGGLRSSKTESHDLEQLFSRVPQELGTEEQVEFRILALGSPRQLRPLIGEEIYWVGREALVNAFRHSGANKVEVELEFAPRRFRLVVRDNGCGIEPQILHWGRDGHWGLPGMRERAERVGAKLRVSSRVAAGTEIELSVPNSIAFDSGNR
jgi:signal transduction histidine kinase